MRGDNSFRDSGGTRRRAAKFASFFAAVSLMFFGTARADDEDEQIEEVVVTGSYIKSSPADSPSPLSVISAADIENNHTVDMNELLLRIPYQSGGYIQAATFTGGGFQGRLPINLRNLGDAATLPLVNGRRHLAAFVAPLGDSTVDINSMIPNMMIDRIEIVKDGASALYGSDAIAGVVNFITKKNFEGVDLDMRFLTDEATGMGDEISFGLLMGAQGDRGGFVMGMDYLDRNEIPTDEKEVYKFQGGFGVSGTGNPGRFPFADATPLFYNAANGGGAVPLIGENGDRKVLPRVPNADPSDPSQWGNADYNCNDAAAWDGLGGTLGMVPSGGIDNQVCAIDYGNFFSIQEGEVLQKFYATGYFNVTDRVELYFEGGYAEQEYYRPNSLAPQSRAPAIPVEHYGLIEDARRRGIDPVPLVSVVRLQGGTRDLTGTGYRPIDTFQSRDGDTLRGVVGLAADLDFGDREWALNASFTWSEQSMDMKRVTDTRAQELSQALQGLGGPNCNPFDTVPDVAGEGNLSYAQTGNFDDGNCYYYNPFGNAHFDEAGNFVDGLTSPSALYNPPELIAWLEGGTNELDEVEQRVIDVVLAGDLFDMPSGPVGMAIGYQNRHDDLNKDYDVNFNQNNVAFRYGAADVDADMSSQAVFVEFNIPLLETLDVQFALRYEDFDDIDTNTTDPKLSVLWRPNDSWSFRASWGESFRVGGLMQLFGTQTIVSNTLDPYNDTEFFLPWISSGNVGLEPEESEAWNIGFSWAGEEGTWQEGFNVNFDYWNYEYENLLTKESAPALLLADGNDRLGPDGIAGTADDGAGNPEQVIRNSFLAPVRILPKFINANSVEVAGADLEVGYEWDNDWGFFRINVATAWFDKYEANTGGATVDGVGSLNRTTILARALPEFKTNVTFDWARDRHSVFVMARFVDEVENDSPRSSFKANTRSLANCYIATGTVCFGEADSYKKTLDSTWWTDIYYNYQLPKMGIIPEGSTVSLGVRNAFDTDVEVVDNAAGFDGIMHDARGRMFMVRYRLSLL